MDKYRGIVALPLLEARISHLVERLQANVANGSYQTQEDLVRSYADIAARISAGMDEAIYKLPKPEAGGALNGDDVNLALLGLYNEILYLVKATIGTGDLLESNFNFACAGVRDLQSALKRIKQKMAVYSLYSQRFGSSRLHGETFSSEESIDRGSALLKAKECSINLAEGTVSLPQLSGDATRKISKIEVGSGSNGNLGNNVEVGTPVRGSLEAVYDGNVDTWCEYERVVAVEDDVALKLDLKIVLDGVQIVNGLKIIPVFLGARTPMIITEIQLSEDGRSWVSLREDVRVAEFIGERPEERFHLSPHSGRFAGEFNVSFAPRFAKLISISIRQLSSFPIEDVYGARWLRYAVGLKEVSVYGYKYEQVGELISKPIDMQSAFSAASIRSLVDPPLVPPEVGKVEYFMTFDDGLRWQQVTSQDEADPNIEEVLFPETETSSLRWKVRLSKDESAFRPTETPTRQTAIEVHPYPSTSPGVIRLGHKAQAGTVTVCDPRLAGRGKLYPKMSIGNGVASVLVQNASGDWERHGNTQLRLKVPLEGITDYSTVNVYVNNVLFESVGDWSAYSRLSRVCRIERSADVTEEGLGSSVMEVVFGNGSAEEPVGMIPSPTDVVSICLRTEVLWLDGVTAPYNVKLDFPSNGNKNDVRIHTYEPLAEGEPLMAIDSIPSGVTKYKLSRKYVWIEDPSYYLFVSAYDATGTRLGFTRSEVSSSPIAGADAFQQYRPFVNGFSELTQAGDWTVDDIGGYLYMKTPTDSDLTFEASYYSRQLLPLKAEDWDFVPGKLDEIQIYESGYRALDLSSPFISVGSKVVNLGVQGIVTKSVRLPESVFGSGVTPFEVPFIDGVEEFRQTTRVQDEAVPASIAAGSPAIASFRLTHYQNLVVASGISFTIGGAPSPTFASASANYTSLSAPGDYYLDVVGDGPNGYGYVYVVLASAGTAIPDGITVSYLYLDSFLSERLAGAYSVDVKAGIVYMSTAPVNTGLVLFKYAPYFAAYVISKEFQEGADWQLAADGQSISLTGATDASHSGRLSVRYDYELDDRKVTELAPYYSPLLRALAVEVS